MHCDWALDWKSSVLHIRVHAGFVQNVRDQKKRSRNFFAVACLCFFFFCEFEGWYYFLGRMAWCLSISIAKYQPPKVFRSHHLSSYSSRICESWRDVSCFWFFVETGCVFGFGFCDCNRQRFNSGGFWFFFFFFRNVLFRRSAPNFVFIPLFLTIVVRVDDPHPPLPANISPQCKDFLLRCFVKDFAKRPTATQLLNHEWIVQGVAGKNSVGISPDQMQMTMRVHNQSRKVSEKTFSECWKNL